MVAKEFERSKNHDLDGLCLFLVTLMNSELTAVHLPSFKRSPPPLTMSNILAWIMNFCRHWLGAGQTQQKYNIQRLIQAIGAESPGLKLIHIKTSAEDDEPIPLTKGSGFGESFFQVLPRLASLQVVQIEFFRCDDWALQQFAKHATNLV